MSWGTFDIDDAVYDNKSFDFGTKDPFGRDSDNIFSVVGKSGTKLYSFRRYSNQTCVYQYSLSTPYDISTASYDTNKYYLPSFNKPTCAFFKPDGTKLYIACAPYNIYESSLSTAWDITTASYVGGSNQIYYSFYIRDNGELAFELSSVSNQYYVYEKTMSTAWTVSTLATTGNKYTLGATAFSPTSIFFNDTGTKMYVHSNQTNAVRQYTLSTAWDITTASYDSISFSLANETVTCKYLQFKQDDGSKMYLSNGRYVYQYSTYNPTSLKSWNGLAVSSIKSINGLASPKSINGLS